MLSNVVCNEFRKKDLRDSKTVLFTNGHRHVLNTPVHFFNLILRCITVETRLTKDKSLTEAYLNCEFSVKEPLYIDNRDYATINYTGTFTFKDSSDGNDIKVVDESIEVYNVQGTNHFNVLADFILGRPIISKKDRELFNAIFRNKLLRNLKVNLASHKLLLSNTVLNFFGIPVTPEDILKGVFSKPEVKITEIEEVTDITRVDSLQLSQDYNNFELLKATGLIDSNITFEEFTSKIEKTLKEVREDEAFTTGLCNLLIEYKNTLNSYGNDTPRAQVVQDFKKLIQEVDLDKLLKE